MKIQNKQGFTLVELLVVISIIAVLSSIVIANLRGAKKNTNYLKRTSDIGQINLAVQQYNSANSKYPSTGGVWLGTGSCSGTDPIPTVTASSTYVPGISKYLKTLPTDPAKAASCSTGPIYIYKSDGREYKLLVYKDTEDSATVLQKNPALIDPRRQASSTIPSFGYWTPNAASSVSY